MDTDNLVGAAIGLMGLGIMYGAVKSIAGKNFFEDLKVKGENKW